jgi:DnaJ-domain-containing protein 1
MRPSDFLIRCAPAIAGALAGAALAGLYGAPAGALLAIMGAEIFRTQRFKSELAAHLVDPGASLPPADEPVPGAALLAGIGAVEARRLGVPPEAAAQTLRGISSLPSQVSAWTARALQAAYAGKDMSLSFAVLAAAFDSRAARSLRPAAAQMLFALLRMTREKLDSEEELATAARLAALGAQESAVWEARRKFFPDYRDPWDILGISPGSDKDEVRKAWRRLSRRYHPDGPTGNAEAFREAREAYDRIRKG